jgi:hypothetical protein
VVDTAAVPAALTPLTGERVRLVSWNKPEAGLEAGARQVFPYPVWTTVEGEVQAFCRAWVARHGAAPAALQQRLEQLLGLRPGDGAGRAFIAFEVERDRVMRPCPDPAVETTQCRAVFDRRSLAAALDRDPEADRFLLEQMLLSYVAPGGYPFTRRGYTYDEAPEAAAGGHVGLSEYVTRPATTVTITARPQDPGSYCAPVRTP